jgi:hypothetical protein
VRFPGCSALHAADFSNESRSNRGCPSRLICRPNGGENGDRQIGHLYWSALAARVLHPAQVEIIEALRWIDRPLSATDLLRIFEGQRVGVRIERRLRQLARIDAIALDDTQRGPMGQRAYRLAKQREP